MDALPLLAKEKTTADRKIRNSNGLILYPQWDSNPQAFRQLILSQPCMPIPP